MYGKKIIVWLGLAFALLLAVSSVVADKVHVSRWDSYGTTYKVLTPNNFIAIGDSMDTTGGLRLSWYDPADRVTRMYPDSGQFRILATSYGDSGNCVLALDVGVEVDGTIYWKQASANIGQILIASTDAGLNGTYDVFVFKPESNLYQMYDWARLRRPSGGSSGNDSLYIRTVEWIGYMVPRSTVTLNVDPVVVTTYDTVTVVIPDTIRIDTCYVCG